MNRDTLPPDLDKTAKIGYTKSAGRGLAAAQKALSDGYPQLYKSLYGTGLVKLLCATQSGYPPDQCRKGIFCF